MEAGKNFLAENAKKEGVVTTASGLQYKVLKEGDGPKPSAESNVEVHYRGTLIDGTEFDSSYKRGEPATFPVSGVIAGWTEALKLMPVGSTWELYIPATLAYGTRGAPPVIGPNETLVFEVELITVKAKDAANDKHSKAQSKSAHVKAAKKDDKTAAAKPAAKTAAAKPATDKAVD